MLMSLEQRRDGDRERFGRRRSRRLAQLIYTWPYVAFSSSLAPSLVE